MARESAGTVWVSIDGDAGPLLAKYAQAEAQSRAAGQRIAQGLGSGLSSASGIVDQFGRSVSSGIVKPLDGVAPVASKVVSSLKEIGSAAKEAEGKTESFVGVIPGLGRAAERFIGLLPGVGQAIMAAFPVLGAIALTENLAHLLPMVGKFAELFDATAEAEKRATEQAKRFDSEIKTLKTDIEQLDDKKFSDIMGGTAGSARQAAEMAGLIRAAQAQVALVQSAISSSGKGGNTNLHGIGTLDKDGKVIPFTSNDLDAAQLNLIKLQKMQEGLSRQSLMSQESDSAKAAADQERRSREAESERKRQIAEEKRERDDMYRQQRQFMELVRQGRKITADENKKLVRDETRDMVDGLREYSNDYERQQDQERRELVAITAERNRANQEQIRAQGVRIGSNDEIAILRAQAVYSIQVVHTKAEELAYVIQIADLEDKLLADRIKSLQVLRDYQAQNLLPTENTDLSIEDAKAAREAAKARSDAEKERAKRRARIGGGLEDIAGGIPGTFGGALASGITGGHLGDQIKQALTGIGKEMMGDVFKDLIAAMIGNSLATIANSAATEINTFWLAIKSFFGGFFADGGRPPVGIPSIVGERGPELFIPDTPGVIIPNVPNSNGIGSTNLTASMISNSSSNALSIGAVHVHGVRNVEEFARRLPNVLKSRSPTFSPATR